MYIKNYEIIKYRDVTAMQEHLKFNPWCRGKPEEEHLTFTNCTEYQKYIRNIDLSSFLGVHAYKKFICPFCGRTEGYLSYYDEEDVWTYRCFAENKTHNIIGVIQHITGCSYSQAVEFINQVYNISLKEDTPLNRAIEHNIRVLSDDDFQERYPYMAKYLGSYNSLLKVFYQRLLSLHNEYLHTKDGHEVIILTTQETREMLNVGQQKARTFLRWIALLSMIEAVHREDLDSKSKKYLERISDYGHYEYASMYHIKPLDDSLLEVCEEKAKELLSLRLTKGNLTLKTIRAITSEFPSDYEVVSPNYSFWKRGAANFAAEEAIRRYSALLMRCIHDKGYIEEKKLPVHTKLKRTLPSGESFFVSVEWKEVRSAVIKICDCSAVPSNRDQLKLLGVTERISGILIIPNGKVYSHKLAVGAVLIDISIQGYALAAKHLPITQAHRKQFREMLEQCGIIAVRLNDDLRAEYKISEVGAYTEIFIERKEGKAD